MKLIVCNRCGKQLPERGKKFLGILKYEKTGYFVWQSYTDLHDYDNITYDYEEEKVDLCEDCCRAVLDFISNGNKEDKNESV